MVVATVIVINYVIGGLSWVHLIWLADATVRFQVSDYSQLYDFTVRFQPYAIEEIENIFRVSIEL